MREKKTKNTHLHAVLLRTHSPQSNTKYLLLGPTLFSLFWLNLLWTEFS